MLEGDVHRSLEKRGGLGSCAADENVQSAELLSDLFEHRLDLIGLGDVGLDDEAASAALADFGEGFLGSGFVLHVVDRDSGAVLRKLECNAASNPARAASNECVLSFE